LSINLSLAFFKAGNLLNTGSAMALSFFSIYVSRVSAGTLSIKNVPSY
jgi:hypothetical protein